MDVLSQGKSLLGWQGSARKGPPKFLCVPGHLHGNGFVRLWLFF